MKAHKALFFLQNTAEYFFDVCTIVAEFATLTYKTLLRMFTSFPNLSLCAEQFNQLVIKSIPIVLVSSFSIGAVMTLQFGYGMQRFGGQLYVPTVVSLSLVRVLGPVFTCLMLASRAGAGIASEIGAMAATKQLDALRALGSEPIHRIAVPRVTALMVGAPILTFMADTVGIFGGMMVSQNSLQISSAVYLQKSLQAISFLDLFVGTFKTIFYGTTIALISCFCGFSTKNGTVGIGTSTTTAVVMGSVVVLVGDVVFTKLSWILGW